MKNNNANFFSIWGGHLRGRYQEVMQAASQELAAQGAMDQQRIQVLMKMLEMEQKKLGALKKAKFQLGKTLLKETGSDMSLYELLSLQLKLDATQSSAQNAANARMAEIREEVEKDYKPQPTQIKAKENAVGEWGPMKTNVVAGNNLKEKVEAWKSKNLQGTFGNKVEAMQAVIDPTLVGNSVVANNFVKAIVAQDPTGNPTETAEIIGNAVFPGTWKKHKENYSKDIQSEINKATKNRASQTLGDRKAEQAQLKEKIDSIARKMSGRNPEAAKIIKQMSVPDESMIAAQNSIDKLKAEIRTKMDAIEAPTYEKVATRAGQIILGEEARREARQTIEKEARVGAAEKILGMPDNEADYYRSLKNARKYFNQTDEELAKKKDNSAKFVNAILKSKDRSWENFNTQAKEKLAGHELEDAQALYASRIYRSGKDAMQSQEEKINAAQNILKE